MRQSVNIDSARSKGVLRHRHVDEQEESESSDSAQQTPNVPQKSPQPAASGAALVQLERTGGLGGLQDEQKYIDRYYTAA